jgi:hypothetical protein
VRAFGFGICVKKVHTTRLGFRVWCRFCKPPEDSSNSSFIIIIVFIIIWGVSVWNFRKKSSYHKIRVFCFHTKSLQTVGLETADREARILEEEEEEKESK